MENRLDECMLKFEQKRTFSFLFESCIIRKIKELTENEL